MRPKPARHRPRITETRAVLFRHPAVVTADMGTRECASAPVFGVPERRHARPAASRLTVPARDPRDRDPRPQALVVQQTALGGTSPRGGCGARAATSADARASSRRTPLARFFTNAIFHGRRRAASVAPPPKSAPPLCATRADRDGGVRATKCGAAPPQGRRRRREQGPAGSRRGRRRGLGERRRAFGAGEPADGAGATGRMASSGPGTTAAAAAARTGAMAAAAAAATGTTRSTADDGEFGPGREPAGVARGVRRRVWVGSTRSTPRCRAPEGEAIPRRRRRWSRRWPPRRFSGAVLGGASGSPPRAPAPAWRPRVRARAQAAAQAVHVGVNAPSHPSGLFRTTRRTRLDGRAFVVIYFCSYCTPTVYSYRVFTPCAR